MTYDTRIIGIDVACGLTVLGMFGTHIDAHIGMITPSNRLEPDTPSDVVSGRSSVVGSVRRPGRGVDRDHVGPHGCDVRRRPFRGQAAPDRSRIPRVRHGGGA